MKKLLTAVLALSLLGCKTGTVTLEGNTVKISTAPSAADAVQIPNPFTSRAGLTDAAKAAGFELAVPEKVNGSPRRDIQTIDGEMIQVFYGDEDDEVCIRCDHEGGKQPDPPCPLDQRRVYLFHLRPLRHEQL